MLSEYQYPDQDDKLFAEMIASEGRNSRKSKKPHRVGVFAAKATTPRYSSYWEASEALAFKRCLPLMFPSRKDKVKSVDIGCGEGRLLSFLSERSSAVVGVEPSRERFEKAAQAAKGLPNAIVVNGTADNLPSESFDVALCSHVIQHLSFDEQDKLAENILRILKPDGIALITTTFCEEEQSGFVLEYWEDGKRVRDTVDASAFNDAYGKDDVIPVRLFSRNDLLKLFDSCEMVACGHFHFSGVKDARLDAMLNRLGHLSRAKDAYYVLKKVQRD